MSTRLQFSDAALQNIRSFASKIGSKPLDGVSSTTKALKITNNDVQSVSVEAASYKNSELPNKSINGTELQHGGGNNSFNSIEIDFPLVRDNVGGYIAKSLKMGENTTNITVPIRTVNKELLSSVVAPSGIKADLKPTPSFSSSSWNKNSSGVKPTSSSNFGKQFSTYTNFSSIKEKLYVPSFSSSGGASSTVVAGNKVSKNITISISAADFAAFNKRLETLEKQAMIPTPKQKSVTDSFVDSLKTDLLELSPKTIEICSTCGFFLTGCVLGASLLDRLWLIGGVIGAYWASHAVYKDSRGGVLARRLGVKIAQLIRDVQEKINGMIIFYNTGRLAIETSKWYEKYDKKFKIDDNIKKMKKLAMNRAADFKGWTRTIESNKYLDTLGDAWTVVTSVPDRAQKWDKEYKITGNLMKFGKGLMGTVQDGVVEIFNRGVDGWDGYTEEKMRLRRGMRNNNRRRGSNGFFSGVTGWMERDDHSHRGYPINPWEFPFESLKGSRRGRYRRSRNKRRYRY